MDPSVKGTEIDPLLEAFAPKLEGVTKAFNPDLGGETWLNWMQLYSLYQVNQISFDDLVARYEPFYKEHGYKDFMEQQRDWRRGMHSAGGIAGRNSRLRHAGRTGGIRIVLGEIPEFDQPEAGDAGNCAQPSIAPD
jgi:hypothetical protein